jgi:hypothetical protein
MRTLGRWGVVLGVALLLASAVPVLAQEGQGGGRGGRGGRGGGMGGGPAQLLTIEVVQKDLKLDQDQIDKVKKVAADMGEKMRSEMSGLRDLSPEERREKMQEVGKKMTEDTMKALADVLKPEQMDRLKQIQLQRRGPQAFTDAEVQKSLNLTDEQKEKIKTINEDLTKEMGDLRGGGRGNPQAGEKMAAVRKEATDKIMAVLTDPQKETWKTMTGKPIEIPFGGPPRSGKNKG